MAYKRIGRRDIRAVGKRMHFFFGLVERAAVGNQTAIKFVHEIPESADALSCVLVPECFGYFRRKQFLHEPRHFAKRLLHLRFSFYVGIFIPETQGFV
jgi:hypothetical protein